MPVLTMAPTLGDVLKWEADSSHSRDAVTLTSGASYPLGLVLGRKRLAGTVGVTFAATAGNTGNGVLTLAGPAYSAAAKEGAYKVVFVEPATNLGTFEVSDPEGLVVGTGVVGSAYNGPVKFTIADGSTDFVAGDSFTVSVAVSGAEGDVAAWDPTATDGTERVAGVHLAAVDATSGARPSIMAARTSIVSRGALAWGAGVTTADQKADAMAALARLGVVPRITA